MGCEAVSEGSVGVGQIVGAGFGDGRLGHGVDIEDHMTGFGVLKELALKVGQPRCDQVVHVDGAIKDFHARATDLCIDRRGSRRSCPICTVCERQVIRHVQRATQVQPQPATRLGDFGPVKVSYGELGARGLQKGCKS